MIRRNKETTVESTPVETTPVEQVVVEQSTPAPVVEGNLAVQPEPVVESRYSETELWAIQTVSGRIRYLHSKGLKRGEIARKLGKLYQHVRNVLNQPLKSKQS